MFGYFLPHTFPDGCSRESEEKTLHRRGSGHLCWRLPASAASSLAAALAIPFATSAGEPFPYRDLILFLTFSVIFITLVLQGLMLPWIIRKLGLSHAGRREREINKAKECKARSEAVEAANERLNQLAAERHLSPDVIEAVRAQHRDRLEHLAHGGSGDGAVRKHGELHDEVERLLIAAERTRINDLFRSGKLQDESRRRIERELDLREAHLSNQRSIA